MDSPSQGCMLSWILPHQSGLEQRLVIPTTSTITKIYKNLPIEVRETGLLSVYAISLILRTRPCFFLQTNKCMIFQLY